VKGGWLVTSSQPGWPGRIDAIPDAVLCIAEGRIVAINAAAEHLFGRRRAELINRSPHILVPALVGASVEMSLRAVEVGGAPVLVATIRDVAHGDPSRPGSDDRALLENQLQQAQRLESLGQLAGGVAHDFNNLLAVILNYTAFVSEELQAAVDRGEHGWSQVNDDVVQIQRAAERAIALTHQLLTFGRREVVQPKLLNLNAVVRDLEALLRRAIGAHVLLTVNLQPGLWTVLIDPGQVEQILINLAVNARDAMSAGGMLRIETANVTVDEEYGTRLHPLPAGSYVRVRVADTGTGMPPEVVRRAFEPFFTTKPEGAGTGLGLATVYGIVTQAGGHIEIDSEPGHGTLITALLPAVDTSGTLPVAGESHPAQVSRPANGETVLLVEDEEAMREVSRRILQRSGYRVLDAADGQSALRIAASQQDRIDLLITDVVMPHMLGKEVAERVRLFHPEARVLYMSGYARPVLAEQGTLDRTVALLSKPFSEAELLNAARDVLEPAGQSDAS
jgi:signal transduction histidine kinase/ActR/RegA family two-component response regulator